MFLWKNTKTLDGLIDDIPQTISKEKAQLALMGSKAISLDEFPDLKGIFRAGIGRDNIPEREAEKKGIIVRYPSTETMDIIYEETANFTCNLIFRMLYCEVGTLDPWTKVPRQQLLQKTLLVIGTGKIGGRVAKLMKPFMGVTTFDILNNKASELKMLIERADCVTIHIPKSNDNLSFIDAEKLSWMKNSAVLVNTARGAIVDEDALYEELKNNRLKAAFDVFWKEPYIGKIKEFYPNLFFMTPHVASTCIGFLQGCRKDLNTLMYDLS